MAALAGSGSNNNVGMAGGGEEALKALLKLLSAGGTAAQQADRAARTGAVQDTQKTQRAYSKENAFSDAQNAMNAMARGTLAKLIPSITRSAEGAGTSQNSMRALLIQQAAMQAADGAAKLGLDAAVNYGNVSNSAGSVLDRLTGAADPVISQLLQALQVSKGDKVTRGGSSQRTESGAPLYGGSRGSTVPSGNGSSSMPDYGVRTPGDETMGFGAPIESRYGNGGYEPSFDQRFVF